MLSQLIVMRGQLIIMSDQLIAMSGQLIAMSDQFIGMGGQFIAISGQLIAMCINKFLNVPESLVDGRDSVTLFELSDLCLQENDLLLSFQELIHCAATQYHDNCCHESRHNTNGPKLRLALCQLDERSFLVFLFKKHNQL